MMGWIATLLDSVVHSLYTEKIKRKQFPLVINKRLCNFLICKCKREYIHRQKGKIRIQDPGRTRLVLTALQLLHKRETNIKKKTPRYLINERAEANFPLSSGKPVSSALPLEAVCTEKGSQSWGWCSETPSHLGDQLKFLYFLDISRHLT